MKIKRVNEMSNVTGYDNRTMEHNQVYFEYLKGSIEDSSNYLNEMIIEYDKEDLEYSGLSEKKLKDDINIMSEKIENMKLEFNKINDLLNDLEEIIGNYN